MDKDLRERARVASKESQEWQQKYLDLVERHHELVTKYSDLVDVYVESQTKVRDSGFPRIKIDEFMRGQ